MKIYDFESFKKHYINTKSIKFKKWKDVTNKKYYRYSSLLGIFGKHLTVNFLSKELAFFYFIDKNEYVFRLYEEKFRDIVEYAEVNAELEIE